MLQLEIVRSCSVHASKMIRNNAPVQASSHFIGRMRLRLGFHSEESNRSDTPLIDHLVMREFVSGPPSYRFIYERVRDRKPSSLPRRHFFPSLTYITADGKSIQVTIIF